MPQVQVAAMVAGQPQWKKLVKGRQMQDVFLVLTKKKGYSLVS